MLISAWSYHLWVFTDDMCPHNTQFWIRNFFSVCRSKIKWWVGGVRACVCFVTVDTLA